MPELLYNFDQQIALWVGQRTGVQDYGLSRSIGVVHNGKIVAGVVYSNFRNGNIEASIAADDKRWCSRTVLRALFFYPFVDLKCRRITCIIPADNEKSLVLCTKLGFEIEGRCREVFGQTDGVICGLLRNHCRWIPE